VYSPHTALDSVWGGINDWLASGLFADASTTTDTKNAGGGVGVGGVVGGAEGGQQGGGRWEKKGEGKVEPLVGLKNLNSTTGVSEGAEGRLVTFDEPVDIQELLRRVKEHLNLKHGTYFFASLSGCLTMSSPMGDVQCKWDTQLRLKVIRS